MRRGTTGHQGGTVGDRFIRITEGALCGFGLYLVADEFRMGPLLFLPPFVAGFVAAYRADADVESGFRHGFGAGLLLVVPSLLIAGSADAHATGPSGGAGGFIVWLAAYYAALVLVSSGLGGACGGAVVQHRSESSNE